MILASYRANNKLSSFRHERGSEELEIDTVLLMVEDLDMDNEHETGVETWHSYLQVLKTW